MSEAREKARALLAQVKSSGFAEGDTLGLLAALCDENDELQRGAWDADVRAHDEVNRRIETSHDLHIRLDQAEAQAAAMRAALTDAEDTIRDQAARFGAGFPCSVIDACEAAIATDAGRALLDRLTSAEAERDALRAELAQDAALRAELTAEVKRLKAFEAAELQRCAILDAMNGGSA